MTNAANSDEWLCVCVVVNGIESGLNIQRKFYLKKKVEEHDDAAKGAPLVPTCI